MEAYTNFPKPDFERHVETFYPLCIELLNRDMGTEVRLALQGLLRRVGECRLGMVERPGGWGGAGFGGMSGGLTPAQTPTSPKSVGGSYFGRRPSRVGSR